MNKYLINKYLTLQHYYSAPLFLLVFLISTITFLLLTTSCEKDEDDLSKISLPSVVTNELTEVSATTAIGGAIITKEGGCSITARGLIWCTLEYPTLEEHSGITSEDTGGGEFTSKLSGLVPKTTYYVRAYASNKIGTAYGEQIKFTTKSELPKIITSNVRDIIITTATSGGMVENEGCEAVTELGVVWSRFEGPTVENNDGKTTDVANNGEFISYITELSADTKYYLRAYTKNQLGITYGDQIEFKTHKGEILTDIDGNVYQTVVIGEQKWMAENLRTSRYSNGENIIHGNNHWVDLGTNETGAWCWYQNQQVNDYLYGKMYNWYAVNDERGLCPQGWRVPTYEDFEEMIAHLGGKEKAGKKLKSTRALPEPHPRWSTYNAQTTNESGFSALPGGLLSHNFYYLGTYSSWWTSTRYNNHLNCVFYYIWGSSNYFDNTLDDSRIGRYVRCIKD